VIAFSAFDSGNFSPFAPEGVGGISAAIPAIFFTFLGIDAVSTAGEEVKDPGRSIPRAVFGAIIIVTAFYVLVAVAAIGAQNVSEFEGQSAGLEAILNEVTGVKWPGIILAAGAVVSIFSVTLITIYGQTRILFAMGRDGMLPPMFKDVNEKTLSPNKNVIFTCVFIAILAAVLPIEKLFDLVSIGTLAAFIVVSATVIILRRTRPDLERPFKVPGGPVIPILSIIACIYAANQIPKDTWLSVGVWVLGALVFYFAYSRKHSIMSREHSGGTA
jgi:basic amino acid/polyamine antiporter, APA family